MSILLTVVFENGFCELYMPLVDNKTCPVAIRPSTSGWDEDIILPLEVWDGVWYLKESRQYAITINEKAVGETVLAPGTLLNCEMKNSEMVFSVTVDEVGAGNTRFNKYFLNPELMPRITMGSGEESIIRYSNSFVSPSHAEIISMGGKVEIRDLDSVNGTFVNGRLLTEKRELRYGDVIYIIGLKIVYLGNILAINNPKDQCAVSRLKPITVTAGTHIEDEEDGGEFDDSENYFLRTPRKLEKLDTESFTIEKCPKKEEQKRQPLLFTIGPSFTMVIPMAVGAMMSSGGGFGASGLVMSVGAAGIGAAWALVNANYQKKLEIEREAKRVGSYQEYISRMNQRIQEKVNRNRDIIEKMLPEARQVTGFALEESPRLWEKSSTHKDFLTVRLGRGDIASYNAISVPKEQAMAEHDPLSDLADQIMDSMSVMKQVPIGISLYDNRILGIVSKDRRRALELSNLVAAQITGLHPYTDVRCCFVYPLKESDHWKYTHWLPHVWTPDGKMRMLCADEASMGDVMYFLSTVIRERLEKEKESEEKETAKVLPHYCVMIADWSMIEDKPVAKYLLHPTPAMGISVVILADQIDRLPNSCTAVIRDDDDYHGFFSTTAQFEDRENVAFDSMPDERMDAYARELSNFKVRESNVSTAIPELLTFLDMYKTSNVESLDIIHKWLENRTYESMKSMIGYKAGEQPLYLDIHEKYHGPHGLVAGTTGSGKSETLQSYILSLAISYHPHEVSFILIDYKGGGMAQSFIGLPHLSGVITNLGGNATNRALLSINAEIKHRQKVFNDYKVKHIDAYIELYRSGVATEPMPHLLIIADEFAELKKEQPEFVRALVSAARVGRSLGVNLILATQKPSGVVDDEIWSNTRFRLCLRVADKQDSQEMLKRPDAASITGTGRGYFQVGNDEIFEEFQSGWSGAEYEPDVPYTDDKNVKVELINLIGKSGVPKKKKKKKSDNIKKVTQLDALVSYMNKLAAENEIPPLRQIWLAPLPSKMYLEDLEEMQKPEGYSLSAPIGLADSPETQSQYPVAVDFLADNHVLVCGASGAGKTTLLQTLIYSLAGRYTADDAHLYIADFSSRTMAVFGQLPQVGSVMFEGDDQKIQETVDLLQETLEQRKKSFAAKGIGSFKEYVSQERDCPALVFIIDNFVAFNESYGQYEDTLVQLSREGGSYGIYLVIACNNTGDLRSRLRQNFTCGIALQMPDKYEYESVVGDRTEIIPEGRTPGRGLIKAPIPVEFQTALCVREEQGLSQVQTLRKLFEARKAQWEEGPSVKKIGESVQAVTYGQLMGRKAVKELPEAYMPLGIDSKEEKLVTVDWDQEFCYSITGQLGTGKTNLLKAVALRAKAMGGRVFLFDNIQGELSGFAQENQLDRVISDSEGLFGLMEDVMVPEFMDRNELVADARDAGADVKEALKGADRIFFLINDMTAFIEAVYNDQYGMSDFVEMALEKGRQHKIQFVACITPDDHSDCARYKAMRQYASYGRGIHLGGMFDQQNILRFEMTAADSVRSLSPGTGYALNAEGRCVTVVTPEIVQEKE